MHKDMNLFSVKTFQQNSLNLLHLFDRYSLIALISRSDCEMWPNFSSEELDRSKMHQFYVRSYN